VIAAVLAGPLVEPVKSNDSHSSECSHATTAGAGLLCLARLSPWCLIRSGLGSCDFNRERKLQPSVPLRTRRLCHPVRDRAHDEPDREWGSGTWCARRCPTVPAFWGRLASVDTNDERDRLAARPLAQERSRLFDQQAEAYDRFRPTYPDAVIEELLGPVPSGLEVLDVGCGTGIASRQIAQRGAKVLGVELARRMAEIARGHGVDVEIAAFEGWDAAGRTFDRVTSAQAWHWLDLPVATAKAASVLRPGGRLCLIWNAGCQPDDLADALEEVYASVVPRGGHRLFRGYAANRSSDVKTGLGSEIDAVSAVPDFGAPTQKWFPWTRAYQRDEWLDQLVSRSDHAALEPAVRDRLFEAIGGAIDDHGGSFVMNFETVLITATRLG
jgi:SAM-dependent methyltransferase